MSYLQADQVAGIFDIFKGKKGKKKAKKKKAKAEKEAEARAEKYVAAATRLEQAKEEALRTAATLPATTTGAVAQGMPGWLPVAGLAAALGLFFWLRR